MARFITPPDYEYSPIMTKVLIKNAPWDGQQVHDLVVALASDKDYDIYLYRDEWNDLQWFEGVRAHTNPNRVYDWNKLQDQDPLTWLKALDNEF